MAWIEYDVRLRDHFKVQRLATLLKVNYVTALGHLSCLWCWAADNAPTGYIRDFTDQELCKASRIEVKVELKKYLKHAGLLNANDRIHDWHKHGLKYLQSTRKRVREFRLRKRYCNVTVTPTLPNLTGPNLTNIIKDPPSATPEQNKKAVKSLVTTVIEAQDPRKISFRDIVVRSGDEVLSEAAKHKLYNATLRVFDRRGWEPSLALEVFKICAPMVGEAGYQPKNGLYPYFDKILGNYVNQNAEILASESKRIREKEEDGVEND